MNEMQVFENKMFGQLRTVEQNGQTWFVAADVCRALEIDPNATRRLDEDEKMTLIRHFENAFGETYSKHALKNILDKAMEKIYQIAE